MTGVSKSLPVPQPIGKQVHCKAWFWFRYVLVLQKANTLQVTVGCFSHPLQHANVTLPCCHGRQQQLWQQVKTSRDCKASYSDLQNHMLDDRYHKQELQWSISNPVKQWE